MGIMLKECVRRANRRKYFKECMEIKNYRVINKGCLKAAFTVIIAEWGGQEIDCCYFEKDNGNYWVNYANKEYTGKDGQKKSHCQVRFPKPVSEKLNKAIQEKIKNGKVEYKIPADKPSFGEPLMEESELPF